MTDPEAALLDRLAALIAASPHNLVAAGERATVRSHHIAEALAVSEVLADRVTEGARWVDLGTGGGLPGLVLASRFPGSNWMLIDAVRKKARAVAEFAAVLDLGNVEVRAARAEDLARDPAYRGRAAGVVARAVAPLPALVELARGFVGDGGWLVAIKGPRADAELAAAAAALRRCGWAEPVVEVLASAPRATRLVTMRAVGPPPEGIPRRTGVPQRRPFTG
jgi:16S rRNA (guanine527-N7)-methyltransferase